MNKIPTVFVRNPDDRKHVLAEVTPGCEWVLAGEGIATRKYDGTCVMFDGTAWWARREVKPGKTSPSGFVEISTDPTTGKTTGWEPIEQSGFARWHAEALADEPGIVFPSGTYELCGPKVNGNPEGIGRHALIEHARADTVVNFAPLTFDGLREFITEYCQDGAEGVVWHHPDGRMAKLKRRDFP